MHRLMACFSSLALLSASIGCGGNGSSAQAPQTQFLPRPSPEFGSVAPASYSSLGGPVRIPEQKKTTTQTPSPKTEPGWEASKGEKLVVPAIATTQQVDPRKGERSGRSEGGRNDLFRQFRGGNNRGDSKGDRGGNGSRSDMKFDRADRSPSSSPPSSYTESSKTEVKTVTSDSGSSSASTPSAATTSAPDAPPRPSSGDSGSILGSFAPSLSGGLGSGSTMNKPVTFGSGSGAARSFKKPTMPSGIPSWFTENDKDGDGQVELHEWATDKLDEFNKNDRNGDGIITIEEAMRTVPKAAVATTTPAATNTTIPAATTTTPPAVTTSTPTAAAPAPVPSVGAAMVFNMAPRPPGQPLSDEDAARRVDMTLQFVDANKDGVIDDKEVENSRSIRNVDWKKYDTNKDNKLDKTELSALFKAEGANMRGGGFGGPGGGMGGPFGGNSEERARVMFNNMDRNKTGKISKENFPSFWQSRFEEFDANKDGFVDQDEFKNNFEKVMQQRGRDRGGDGRGGRGFGGGRGGFGG
jgi:Ca2+-binding EF-hand superfamily protein